MSFEFVSDFELRISSFLKLASDCPGPNDELMFSSQAEDFSMGHRFCVLLFVVWIALGALGFSSQAQSQSENRKEIVLPLQTGSMLHRRIIVPANPEEATGSSKKKEKESSKKKAKKDESKRKSPTPTPSPAKPKPPKEEPAPTPERFR